MLKNEFPASKAHLLRHTERHLRWTPSSAALGCDPFLKILLKGYQMHSCAKEDMILP